MRALAVVLLLAASSSFADPPADSPIVLKSGTAAPVDGVLLPNATAVNVAKRLSACEAAQPVLVKGVEQTPPWWVVPVVAIVAAGAGVGVGMALHR